jgi:hypothetical protein
MGAPRLGRAESVVPHGRNGLRDHLDRKGEWHVHEIWFGGYKRWMLVSDETAGRAKINCRDHPENCYREPRPVH